MIRILFLGNNSEESRRALKILQRYSNNIYCIDRCEKITEFPEYDLGIGFLYTYKIPKEQLNKTWINFHPAVLPNYGGRNLAYHAIMNQAKVFGGTIHYMNEKFDEGNIIECKTFPIKDSDTAGDLVNKSYEVLLELFEKYADPISQNALPDSFKQDKTTYYPKKKIDDFINIRKDQEIKIKAVTVNGKYYAKIRAGGIVFNLIPEGQE